MTVKHPVAEETRSTQEHWDRVYESVQTYYGLYLYQHQLLDIIRARFDHLGGKRILEVGCGKGNELAQLVREGAECLGLDFSESAIRLLSERRRTDRLELALVRGDARQLPFAPNYFDVIFSQGVLEHFTDPTPVLREQHRVLRPGGYVVVEVPNKWTLYTVYKKALMSLDRWPPGWETQYSPGELTTLMHASGFAVLDCVGWDAMVLKVIRKLRKILGVREKPETSLARRLRHRLERHPVLINFFASVTVVGQKPV